MTNHWSYDRYQVLLEQNIKQQAMMEQNYRNQQQLEQGAPRLPGELSCQHQLQQQIIQQQQTIIAQQVEGWKR